MFTEALLVGVVAGIAGIDLFNGLTHMHRPIVIGPIVGFILGDFKTGLLAGATLELVWAGMVPLAGAQPPNVVVGGVMGTALAILTKQEPAVAVGLAVPFAVAAQGCITLLFTIYSPVMHKMDKYAEKAETKGIDMFSYLGPLVLFVFYFIIAFLPIYFGSEYAEKIVLKMPVWLISGLGVAGGIMPAVGFAMLLKIMFDITYAPFFAIGFIAAAYLQLPVLAIAVIGVSFAAYDYFNTGKPKGGSTPEKKTEEEDYKYGI